MESPSNNTIVNNELMQNSEIQIMKNLGFHNLTSDSLQKTAITINTIFNATYPEKNISGTLMEQCIEASKFFKDLPSIVHFNSLIPIREPVMVSGELQRQKYDLWFNESTGLYEDLFIPIPNSSKQEWNIEQIISYFKAGYPIFLRTTHKEEKFYKYGKNNEAILPSRVNVNDEETYNPQVSQSAIYNFRPSAFPPLDRFSDETQSNISEIKKKQGLSESEAYLEYFQQFYKKKNVNKINYIQSIFWEIFNSHATACTNRTPFKGMVGGTHTDPLFLKEMKEITAAFRNKNVMVIIDFSGRFIYNPLNRYQKREFLALGGILHSEVVAHLTDLEFASLSEKLMAISQSG